MYDLIHYKYMYLISEDLIVHVCVCRILTILELLFTVLYTHTHTHNVHVHVHVSYNVFFLFLLQTYCCNCDHEGDRTRLINRISEAIQEVCSHLLITVYTFVLQKISFDVRM